MSKDFKKLEVWGKSHALAVGVFQASTTFPKEELYGLTSQIKRSCVSIPANIAEGCGRDGDAEFSRFLQISLGSTTESEYHLLLAHDLQYLNDNDYHNLNNKVSEVRRMLISLIKKIRNT